MQKYSDVVLDKNGKGVKGLTITVTTYPGGLPATVYATDGGPSVASVKTDSTGRFSFYAANGRYSLAVGGSGIAPVSYNDIALFDPRDDRVNVRDFIDTAIDGVTSNQAGIVAAVARALATGATLAWPAGTYVSDASIPNFHDVRHVGAGVLKRGGNLWPVTADRTGVRVLYVSPTGNDVNDGLTANAPAASIQTTINRIHRWGPVIGRQQVVGPAGVYAESVTIPDGLAQENNYLEFKFPSAPGVRGDPTAWPAGAAILDGTGLSGDGFKVGRYNKVYIEYLLVRNWFDTTKTAIQQVVSGITIDQFSLLYTYGVSYFGNGWNNLYVQPNGAAVITGGIADGARYGINNTGGRISFSASNTTYTTVRNALEYGLYSKHQNSNVLDYAEFVNCGRVSGAESYGAALFAYKTGASIDTRNCTFKQNNIAYHARGGYISTEIPSTDTLGSGVDANLRAWKTAGFGANDLINYKSSAGRELAQTFAIATTTSTTTVTIVDNVATIPAGYFTNPDQYLEIEIFGSAATGTGTVRPTFTSTAPSNYAFGAFTVAANTEFKIRLLVYPTGVSAQLIQFDNVAATSGGLTLNDSNAAAPFDTSAMTFKVRGEITAGTLEIKRVRVVLWG